MAKKRRAKSAKDFRRRPAFRAERDRVLIVTEGSKTEPDYFRRLIDELGLTTAKVRIVGQGDSAPISVVRDAERQLKTDDDFEQIYCVFDRDRHDSYDPALAAVEELASRPKCKSKVVRAVTSVPCFEIWYLLHVSDSRRPYEAGAGGGSPAASLLGDLRARDPFTRYDKTDCKPFYDTIASSRREAKTRAKRCLAEAHKEGADKFHENPSTRVHLLVEALEELARKQD